MPYNQTTPGLSFIHLLTRNQPRAMAWVRGGTAAPELSGLVKFYDTPYGGILIEAEIFGLPNRAMPGSTDWYAMHIHETGDCSNQFMNTGEHYNPDMVMHPQHAGDLMPLFANQGYAWYAYYDKRFQIPEILNRSVVIHQYRDDFSTQPAGASGSRIGCGIIRNV
ncbi:MAG: superoxide dismutase family protein [Roseburia sp.]|nr:superoxide dismutase family protein [Roseburia sp.]